MPGVLITDDLTCLISGAVNMHWFELVASTSQVPLIDTFFLGKFTYPQNLGTLYHKESMIRAGETTLASQPMA